jgi:alpha-glucosidase
MINRQALFTDETVNFKVPYEPCHGDQVSLQIRTLRNDVSAVYVIMGARKHAMKKVSQDTSDTFDFYQYTFTCPQRQVSYYFEICDDDEQLYYNRLGVVTNNQEEYNFSFTPGHKVPDWALGKVFYQIYPDRFCNGDPTNDVCNNEYYYTGGHTKRITNWDKIPDHLDVSNFYGGDLQGIRSKLDYLQDLGVEAIYLNPIFVSPSNHKYDTQDYDYVDPHLAIIEDDNEFTMQNWERHNGFAARYIKRVTSKNNLKKSNEYFADLVKELHSRGIKIVIDGVFNHCGSFNKWMDREGIYLNKEGYELGAYQSVDSPYRNYFKFDKNVAHSDYEGWWGFQTLPKLNYEKSEELKNYVLATGAKWVSAPYNVDGWRLDVGADLGHSEKFNHKFWQEFHTAVKSANPEAFIFAEHYGDPSKWLESGKEWDSVMNYDAFMEPVTWFLTGVDKHSKSYNDKWRGNGKAFFEAMFKAMARFPRPALDSAINQLSNHDHSRFLTRTNGRVGTIQERGGAAAGEGIDKRVMKLAILIQMTWVGSPALYYADEVGQVGWTDPDSRRTFPWGHEDWDLYNTYKSAIALRKKVHCIRMGSLLELDAGDGYIAYGRFDIADSLITVINSSDKEIALAVPVWQAGVTWQDKLKLAFAVGYQGASAESTVDVNYGRAYIKIPPKSGVCYYKRFSGQPMKSLRLYVGDVRFTTKFYQFKQFRHII